MTSYNTNDQWYASIHFTTVKLLFILVVYDVIFLYALYAASSSCLRLPKQMRDIICITYISLDNYCVLRSCWLASVNTHKTLPKFLGV